MAIISSGEKEIIATKETFHQGKKGRGEKTFLEKRAVS